MVGIREPKRFRAYPTLGLNRRGAAGGRTAPIEPKNCRALIAGFAEILVQDLIAFHNCCEAVSKVISPKGLGNPWQVGGDALYLGIT